VRVHEASSNRTGLGRFGHVIVEIGITSKLQTRETQLLHSSSNFRPSEIPQYLETDKLAPNSLLACQTDSGSGGTEFQRDLVEKSSVVGSPPPRPPPLPATPISPPIVGQFHALCT